MADGNPDSRQEKVELIEGGGVMLGGDNIIIRGLRQNNLKNVSLNVPKSKLAIGTPSKTQ